MKFYDGVRDVHNHWLHSALLRIAGAAARSLALWITLPAAPPFYPQTYVAAMRNATAFRHALATGHRLREAGERMTDAKIIDAYERAYNIAQAIGADNRESEMPSQRDRVTMTRRVRGYVMSKQPLVWGVRL